MMQRDRDVRWGQILPGAAGLEWAGESLKSSTGFLSTGNTCRGIKRDQMAWEGGLRRRRVGSNWWIVKTTGVCFIASLSRLSSHLFTLKLLHTCILINCMYSQFSYTQWWLYQMSYEISACLTKKLQPICFCKAQSHLHRNDFQTLKPQSHACTSSVY